MVAATNNIEKALHVIDRLEENLAYQKVINEELKKKLVGQHIPIAVIGSAISFPGNSITPSAYWEMLCDKHDAITEVPKDRWDIKAYFNEDLSIAGKMATQWGGFIEHIDLFDPYLFGISPQEACFLDPQHRLLLLKTYHALEDACIPFNKLQGQKIGVFIGNMTADYGNYSRAPGYENVINAYETVGNESSFIAGRIAYWLETHGPTMVVSTACSSSLVALHLACQSLRQDDCGIAIVGAANVIFSPYWHIASSKLNSQAKNGRCKTFDALADGYVRGEGCAVVILKRSDLLDDNEDVAQALIHGTAITHNGKGSSLTAPNPIAQYKALSGAIKASSINANDVGYIETHGSGTPLGDIIEIEALKKAYINHNRELPLILGAVKTNIGHLEAASGMAGLIKVIQCLKHKKIPANLHLSNINSELSIDPNYMKFPVELMELPKSENGYYAGISSFGLSGTNAHVILGAVNNVKVEKLESNKQVKTAVVDKVELRISPIVLGISAKSAVSLKKNCINMLNLLCKSNDASFQAIAYSSLVARFPHVFRIAILARDRRSAIEKLGKIIQNFEKKDFPMCCNKLEPVFLFPGFGEQYQGMGYELYRDNCKFQEGLDECDASIKRQFGFSIIDFMYANSKLDSKSDGSFLGPEATIKTSKVVQKDILNTIYYGHIAIFCVSYALTKVFKSWGVCPSALLGHSLGELTAACISGVFSLDHALYFIYRRAYIVSSLPKGKMLAVAENEKVLQQLLPDTLDIAVVSSPKLCVITGNAKATDSFKKVLDKNDIFHYDIRVTHAMHGRTMKLADGPLQAIMKELKLNSPQIPFISNITGDWIKLSEARDMQYFIEHLSHPVKLWDGLKRLINTKQALFEMGPGTSLTSLVNGNLIAKKESIYVFPTIPNAMWQEDSSKFLLNTVAKYWQVGGDVNWTTIFKQFLLKTPKIVQLPKYEFDLSPYWADHVSNTNSIQKDERIFSCKQEKIPIEQWGYLPTWEEIKPRSLQRSAKDSIVVFVDKGGYLRNVFERSKVSAMCYFVYPSEDFSADEYQSCFTINPACLEHYQSLLNELGEKNIRHVVHGWSLNSQSECLHYREFIEAQAWIFESLLLFVKALGNNANKNSINLNIIVGNLFSVYNNEVNYPHQATALGIYRCLPAESKQYQCRIIDIDMQEPSSNLKSSALESSIYSDISSRVVAIRCGKFWSMKLSSYILPSSPAINYSKHKSYLITGAFGGIGFALAEYLAKNYGCQLILVGRNILDKARQLKLTQLKKYSSVEVVIADLANPISLVQGVEKLKNSNKINKIHGIFHCAGVPGQGLLMFKTVEQFHAVVAPKISGILAIRNIAQQCESEFCVSFSSSVNFSNFAGESDYCAANSALDAYSMYLNKFTKTKFVTINWGAWQWDAWQVDAFSHSPALANDIKKLRERIGIKFFEGIDIINRILASELTQVVVLTQQPELYFKPFNFIFNKLFSLTIKRTKRPMAISSHYVRPDNEIQQRIAIIWQNILGIDQIGIDDNFFELGGQSLIAITLLTKLNGAFHASFSPSTLFSANTIRKLAEVLTGGKKKNGLDAISKRALNRRRIQLERKNLKNVKT